MNIQKKLAATGLTVGLLGGGIAGAVLTSSGISGAAPTAVAQAEPPAEGEATEGRGSHIADALAPLVSNGTIDQAQADAVAEALREAAPQPGERGGKGHHGMRLGAGEVAESLGLDAEAFRDAIREGSTPAEAAQAQGVEPQALIDAMVAQATERTNQAVEDGKITQEQADEKLAEIQERITDSVNNGMPSGGHRGPGGPGGHRGPGAIPEADAES